MTATHTNSLVTRLLSCGGIDEARFGHALFFLYLVQDAVAFTARPEGGASLAAAFPCTAVKILELVVAYFISDVASFTDSRVNVLTTQIENIDVLDRRDLVGSPTLNALAVGIVHDPLDARAVKVWIVRS